MTDTGDGQLLENEHATVGLTQLLVVFNKAMNSTDASSLGSYQLVRDGSTPVAIDGADYSPTTQTTTVLLNGGAALPDGRYTFIVKGDIRDQLGTPIGADFVRNFYVGAASGAGIYDDSDATWTWSGSWTPVSGATGPYASTHSYTGTVGDYAEFAFNGVKFRFTYLKANNRGLIDVLVDGTRIATINAYSPTLTWQQTWMSPTLTAGFHTVRFVHAGGHRYIDIDAIEIFAPAPTVGPGNYDDNDLAWTFSSSWITYNGGGPANNTLHYTSTAGSDAQLTFNGNRFTFTYVKAYNRGRIDIYVDGMKITTLNAKSTSTAWQQTWTSPILTPGIHTVRFVHAGGGTYIDVDAIQIFAPSDLVAPAAIIDLTGAAGTTTGSVDLSWTAPGDDGATGTATNYLARYSTTAITDETTWNAATPVSTGIPTPVTAGNPQTMTVSGLAPGTNYFFAIRAQDEEGNLGGSSNSTSVVAQSILPVTAGTYDDTDVNWIYTGTWTTYTGAGPANNTSHYASARGSEAQITIDGAKFIFTYVKASNRGSIDVYVDGTKAGTINARSATTTWQAAWMSPTLTPGVHVVRFVYAGGTYIDVDKIQVVDVVGAGTYDDTDANWAYLGTWTSYAGTGPANNTNHYTNLPGSEAQLVFNGTQFDHGFFGTDLLDNSDDVIIWQPYTFESQSILVASSRMFISTRVRN
jgi:hypothetical protein